MRADNHPLYKLWANMRARCERPYHSRYEYYGGRGITVCPQWSDFWTFVEDMGERPDGTSIDRINSNGNYEPDNCRWATQSEQNLNRRIPSIKMLHSLQNISQHHNRWHVRISLNGRRHIALFDTREEAIDYRDQCLYEREFHRMLGL